MKAWSHLPNAHHIDRVIKSVKDNPEVWAAARVAAWDAARAAGRVAASDAARVAARVVGRVAARVAARVVGWVVGWVAAREESWDAIAALIAWDDSAQFLEMTSDELEVWARLSNDPRAIMLLPAVRAFERIKSLKTV